MSLLTPSASAPTRSRIPFKWEMNVTISMAKGKNVLNFPREYSRNCLMRSETTINLLDVATGKVFKSELKTSSKNHEDRYIYKGWTEFVKEKNLKVKDKVIFSGESGSNVINVQIIRREFSR